MPPRKLDLQPMGAHQAEVDKSQQAEWDRRYRIDPKNVERLCVDCGIPCGFGDKDFNYCRDHAPRWMTDPDYRAARLAAGFTD